MSLNPVSPVFVGRAPELALLDEALRTADGGTPAVVLLAGEAGVGKTRLLEEFLAAADRRGAVTAVGGCIELGADSLPFAPIAGALRMLDSALGDRLAQAAAGREADLARLAPALVPGGRPAGDGDGADRVRLYDLTLHLLEVLSADRTLVIAVEDLHWADSATRELLAYWVRTLRRARVLLVATYRADAIDRRHPLRPLLAELERVRTVRRADLARLTRGQVADQLRGILGSEPSAELAEQVHRRSEGNAFFVEELAGSVRDGRLTRLSDSLRDLLLIRIEQLPDSAQRVVRLAAIGGATVPHRLLAEVAARHARIDADTLDTALRAAIGAYVLAPARDGDGYTFRHALVREAATDDLLPGERMRGHAAFAQILEDFPDLVGTEEAVARAAAHWWAAENPARALPALLAAARQAGDRYAFGEQLRLLDGALDMWERLPDPAELSGTTQLDILEEAAAAARYHSSADRGLALLRQALDIVDADAEPRRAAMLWHARALLLRNHARADGFAELRKAEALLARVPVSAEHASVRIQIARARLLDGHVADAVGDARDALEIARASGDRAAEADVSKTLAWFLLNSGDVDEAEATGRDSIRLAEDVDSPDLIVHVLANHASLLEGLGRHEDSVEVAVRALEIAKKRGQRHLTGFTSGNLAESLLSLGRWAEADQVASDASALNPGMRITSHLERILAQLAAYRGDTEAAAKHRARGHVTDSESYLEPQGRIPHRGLEIAAAREAGNLALARELARTQAEEGILVGHQRYGWPLAADAARTEAELGGTAAGPDEAPDGSASAVQVIRDLAASMAIDCPLDAAYAATTAALLDDATGIPDPVTRWQQADAAWSRTTKPYYQARAKLDLAAAYASAGRRPEAAEALAAAHATAAGLGAVPLRDAAELLARRLGVDLAAKAAADESAPHAADASPVGPGTGNGVAASLTPREREVLARLAQGHSNRRIAEELFISVKTASVHVSNILAKMEVANRGEAAALAHRLGLVDDQA
ncbi:helix-turn-helix transcriptional regulator [Yinghuangia soli]|uniref:AAA family ATPase n=1 Tax=Yinghuangia soli TaxID=2908204 RepID=A0AA41U733_9ACTN|nr:helix-turn-helix transcriptional regulator [Yinghuangia soli]MCF2531569.1 AAA family ATPase [Yinghuangia soli]